MTSQATSTALSIRPVGPACGADVTGVGLINASEAELAALRQALDDHGVVFVRDQHLTPVQQVALTAQLGEVLRVPFIGHLDEHPDVIAVLKEADERNISTFGGTWHSDFSFLEEPPSYTVLQSVELPDVGGDTIWSNQYRAYETLSPGLQRMLDPLRAVQTGWPHGTTGPSADDPGLSRSVKMARKDPSADREVLQPVVRVHPNTGRKALFVNPVYTQRFEDMTAAESAPLLRFLFEHAVKAEFQVRLRWTPGTLAIWDNRCLLHLAVNDYDGCRRLLHRTTVRGERPIPAA